MNRPYGFYVIVLLIAGVAAMALCWAGRCADDKRLRRYATPTPIPQIVPL